MLLAKTKLKSSNKVEYTAGLTLNLLFLWLVVQSVYCFFCKSDFGGLDVFNTIVSFISFSIAYFLFSDNGYSKKHVGTLEWYKNILHIKNQYVVEIGTVISAIFFGMATIVLVVYVFSLPFGNNPKGFNPYFAGILLYVVLANMSSFLTSLKMSKMEIFSDDLLKINNITEFSQRRRAEFKEQVMNKIKYEGSITRKQMSLIIEDVEKEHKRYKNRERGLYDDFINSK